MTDSSPNDIPQRTGGQFPSKVPLPSDVHPYPIICWVVFIADLMCATAWACLGALNMMILFVAAEFGDSHLTERICLVATIVMMVVTGAAASIMMLCRIKAGTYVGILKVLAVISSYAVSIWFASIAISEASSSPWPEQKTKIINILAVVGTFLIIRIALLALYVVATFKFYRWARSRQNANAT